MEKKKPKKPRKPREFRVNGFEVGFVEGRVMALEHVRLLKPKNIRKLVAWLEKAAAWIESQEGEK